MYSEKFTLWILTVADDMGAEIQEWGQIDPILEFTMNGLYYTATQVGGVSDNKWIVEPQLDMYNEQCGDGGYNHQNDAYFEFNNRHHWLENVLHAEHLTAQSWSSELMPAGTAGVVINVENPAK